MKRTAKRQRILAVSRSMTGVICRRGAVRFKVLWMVVTAALVLGLVCGCGTSARVLDADTIRLALVADPLSLDGQMVTVSGTVDHSWRNLILVDLGSTKSGEVFAWVACIGDGPEVSKGDRLTATGRCGVSQDSSSYTIDLRAQNLNVVSD